MSLKTKKAKPAVKSSKLSKVKAGQPTKYRLEYCEAIVTFSKKLGNTITAFACGINVDRETLYTWAREHKEFSNALKRAKVNQENVMEQLGLKGCVNSRSWSAPTYIFMMKARYGWREEPKDEDLGDDSLEIEFQ